jgi:hypothetical protein
LGLCLSARRVGGPISNRTRVRHHAADARKYAAIAELEPRRNTGEHPNWACDDWDAAAAEVAAALNVGHGRASCEMDVAVMLRDRFPKVGALFLAGALDAPA